MSVGAYQRGLVRQLTGLSPEALSRWMNSASYEEVIMALHYGRPPIRAAAARHLGGRFEDPVDLHLADMLVHEDEASVTEALIEGLAERQTPASIRALINYLDEGRCTWKASNAIAEAFNGMPVERHLPTLLDLLKDPVSPAGYRCKHSTLVRILATTRHPEVFDAFVRLARTTTRHGLLADVLRAISEFDDPRVLPTIASLLERDVPCSRFAIEAALLNMGTAEALVVWMLGQDGRVHAPHAQTSDILSRSPALSTGQPALPDAPGLPAHFRLYQAIEVLKSRAWQSYEAAGQMILKANNPLVYQHLVALLNTHHGNWLLDTITPLWVMHVLGQADYPQSCTAIARFANLTTVSGLFAIRALKVLHARYPCAHCEALLQELLEDDRLKRWRTKPEILTHQALTT